MNGQRSTAKPGSAVAAALDTALPALWETVPAGMRLTYFSQDTVPAQYRGGLGQRRGRPLGVDLTGLPGPIRKELAWCIYASSSRVARSRVERMSAVGVDGADPGKHGLVG